MATIEETVQTEQEAYENELAARADELEAEAETELELQPGETEEEPLADAGDGQLFDGSIYNDPRLKIEKNGRTITHIAVAFGGTVDLNRWSHDHVAWHQGLKEGSEVELLVTATVTKDGFQFKPATEKAGAKLVETKTLTIHSIDDLPETDDA